MIRCVMATHVRAETSKGQVYPFYKYRDELVRRFGFDFEEVPHENTPRLKERLQAAQPDIVVIQDRPTSLDYVKALIDMARAICPRAKIVLLDAVDSTYARQLPLLPHVELYIKGQLLADLSMYEKGYLNGRIFADFMIRHQQLKSKFTGAPYSDKAQLAKVMLGWNFGVSEIYERPFAQQNYQPLRNGSRDIDICCRVRTERWPFRSWYTRQRTMALDAVRKLKKRYRVVASENRTPRDQYYDEMRRSRIAVSPFGWGEICGRDFEAIFCGSLLVKPDMSHCATKPDIYVDGKTYVAVKWDFSDLAEKCEYYLTHDTERLAIIEEAGRRYAQYFQGHDFLNAAEEMLRRLGV